MVVWIFIYLEKILLHRATTVLFIFYRVVKLYPIGVNGWKSTVSNTLIIIEDEAISVISQYDNCNILLCDMVFVRKNFTFMLYVRVYMYIEDAVNVSQ